MDDGDKLTSVTQGGTTVKSYTYDAAGRTKTVVSSAGTTTLGYDYEGRATSISGPGVSDTFSYNGLDTRVGKVEAGGTRTFRRDGAGVTAPVLSDGAAVYTPGVSQRRSGATTYDLSDRLGTAAKQTNASAATTATRTYDAFGLLVASTGSPLGPFGFVGAQGYQEDGDTGLKLLGHRYYDPSTGRFLTRDRVKEGRNWYAYCHNGPLRGVDPKGFGDTSLDGNGGEVRLYKELIEEDGVDVGYHGAGQPPTPEPAPEPGPGTGETNLDPDDPVYRGGKGNPGNFRPRPGTDDGGWSGSTQPRPGPNMMARVRDLVDAGFDVIKDGFTHVSIAPIGGMGVWFADHASEISDTLRDCFIGPINFP